MNQPVIAKHLGLTIPLTSAPHPEYVPLMVSGSGFGGMGFDQNRLQSLPSGIRNWPDRFRGNRNRLFLTCHNVTLGPEVIYLSAKK